MPRPTVDLEGRTKTDVSDGGLGRSRFNSRTGKEPRSRFGSRFGSRNTSRNGSRHDAPAAPPKAHRPSQNYVEVEEDEPGTLADQLRSRRPSQMRRPSLDYLDVEDDEHAAFNGLNGDTGGELDAPNQEYLDFADEIDANHRESAEFGDWDINRFNDQPTSQRGSFAYSDDSDDFAESRFGMPLGDSLSPRDRFGRPSQGYFVVDQYAFDAPRRGSRMGGRPSQGYFEVDLNAEPEISSRPSSRRTRRPSRGVGLDAITEDERRPFGTYKRRQPRPSRKEIPTMDSFDVQRKRKQSVLLQSVTDKKGNATEAATFVDDVGVTVLHKAARTGDLEAVNFLLGIGLDVQARAENGSTPAHDAAASGNVDCLQSLLWNDPELAETTLFKNRIDVLHLACMFGRANVASFLVEQGYSDPTHPAHNGSTPLHYAAASGQNECVEFILSSIPPEDVNATNRDGDTALHRAAYEGHADIVEELLGAGADVFVVSRGLLPSHMAARKGHLDVIKVLHEHDAKVLLAKTEDGASVWHHAAASGHEELMQWLLHLLREMEPEDAEDVWSDVKWNTPVHDAAAHGNLEIIRLLHIVGVVLDSENLEDKTPAQIAREMNQAECAIFLTLKTSN